MSVPEELIKTESDKVAIKLGCYFDESEPLRVKAYIEKFLSNSKGDERGKKIKLLDWQYNEVIKPLYGWRKIDGSARFNMCQLWIPKKNGKSFLLSALASYHTAKEKGGEVYCVAGTQQQADIIFAESCNHVGLNETLKKNFWVRRAQMRIENRSNGTKYIVLPFSVNAVQGYDANAIFIDELASWPAGYREVWSNLNKSTMSRRAKGQTGLIFVASTAQFDCSHLGFEQFNYCKEILAGTKIDITVLPIVYALDLDEDWSLESNWQKCNPSIGHTVSIDFYREEFNKTKNLPNEEAAFRTLLLNQFYGSAKNWISTNVWQNCYEEFDEREFENEQGIISIDASRKHDLSCITASFARDNNIYVLQKYYSVRSLAEQKQKTDNVPYLSWESQGFITLTQGTTIDFNVMIQDIVDWTNQFQITEIRFDPYALQETIKKLSDDYYLNCVEVNQSPSVMSAPTAYFEQLITSNRLRHTNNPILNWCLGNTAVRFDNQDRIMVDKMKSNGRIDGVSSIITGLSYWITQENMDLDSPIFGFL